MIALELLLLLALILLNGVLAMAELATASARKARLQARADQGSAGARAALELATSPNRFLSTVQIGITLIGIVAGAYGGATLAEPLARALARVPPLAPLAEPLAVVVAVALITYFSLVLGELVPKRLALQNPEGIAALVARPMGVLSKATGPLVWLLGISTDRVLRLLGVRASNEPTVTEDEIALLLQEGTHAGVFEPAEQTMINRVFDLGDRRAGELMTPRYRVVALDLRDSPAVLRQAMADAPHEHYPVGDGGLDRLVGVVSATAMWARELRGEPADLRAAMRRPTIVPETLPVLRVLERFKRTGDEVAVVVDEYGGVQGLLTLHDILEAIAGDIGPPDPDVDPAAVRRPDGSWLLDGAFPAHELRVLLGIADLPGEVAGDFETLGGFVMTELGRIPAVGDRVAAGGWRFEVVDMDGHRVDRVLAGPVAPADEGAEGAV